MKLLTMVLNNSEDEIKLRRSNQIADILFTALEGCKISIENDETNVDILNLLLTLHPSSFDEQRLLNIIFNIYHSNKVSIGILEKFCSSAFTRITLLFVT